MSEQHPEPVPEDSVPAEAPPKAPSHPLRGWLIAVVVEMALLIVAVLSVGGAVWLSSSPNQVAWGPERAVTITVKTNAATGTVQAAIAGQVSTMAVSSEVNPTQTWSPTLHFGEGAKVVATLSQEVIYTDSWDSSASITCTISDGKQTLAVASVSVVDNTAVCEWTNR